MSNFVRLMPTMTKEYNMNGTAFSDDIVISVIKIHDLFSTLQDIITLFQGINSYF